MTNNAQLRNLWDKMSAYYSGAAMRSYLVAICGGFNNAQATYTRPLN
jgi:hypothetical protein